jgi:hypothetical protein
MTTTTAPVPAPAVVLGDLTPGPGVGERPCIPITELRIGDTLFATGFRRGACRRVLEVRHAHVDRWVNTYVRVAEGWYRWNLIYAIVLEF